MKCHKVLSSHLTNLKPQYYTEKVLQAGMFVKPFVFPSPSHSKSNHNTVVLKSSLTLAVLKNLNLGLFPT